MKDFNARDMAEAYAQISTIQPPSIVDEGSLIFGDLALLRSVDPIQQDYLEKLSQQYGSDSEWARICIEVTEQRELRNRVYNHISELDSALRASPVDFVFPDAYSLLFWIWTFQLFREVYLREPGESWKKYFYRGESCDFGSTRFLPTIARPNVSTSAKGSDLPPSLLGFLQLYLTENQSWKALTSDKSLVQMLIETMSGSQALAVAQHYGYPTPLVDVSVNPEIALYFATNSAKSEIGVVGYLDASTDVDRMRLTLVMAPPLFSRIHRQTGYFICASPEKISETFTRLQFHHQPELEPVKPTWIGSHGFLDGSVQMAQEILLDDPYDLENHLKDPFPKPPSLKPLSDITPPSIDDLEFLLNRSLGDLYLAACRHGMTPQGRRFMEPHPVLLYSLFRFAPYQAYIQAISLQAASHEMGGPYKILFDCIMTVQGRLLSHLISEEVGVRLSEVNLSHDDIMHFWGKIVRAGDIRNPPWPINAWYNN